MGEISLKWTLDQAVEAGKKSEPLAEEHEDVLKPRLRPDELEQHAANVAELEARRSGQEQSLSDQKSKTQSQARVISSLNIKIVGIHNLVRSGNHNTEICEAFGTGKSVVKTVGGVTSAANIILDGYKLFSGWSKDAGIIEADITRLKGLLTILNTVEKAQDDSMYSRKAKTMGKNELQYEVEKGVTRLSAMGSLEFGESNPAKAKMFEDVIPAAPAVKESKKGKGRS